MPKLPDCLHVCCTFDGHTTCWLANPKERTEGHTADTERHECAYCDGAYQMMDAIFDD